MNKQQIKLNKVRFRRTRRVRNKLRGDAARPRLCVVKSNKHLHVQLIDDESGRTLGTAATFGKEFQNTEFAKKNKASAAQLGTRIAEIALNQNIKHVIFDRGPFKYHGVLAELANAARAAGLQF